MNMVTLADPACGSRLGFVRVKFQDWVNVELIQESWLVNKTSEDMRQGTKGSRMH